MKKFWNWTNGKNSNNESELFLYGAIASETWFDDDITPEMFRNDLNQHIGDITVWINSPGGDVFAASQIYTMLKNHNGKITVKIDGIAASAASVIAMAGDETLIAPTGMLMIHNPSTTAWGDKAELQKAIILLDEIKESIINAYETKTNLSRAKIARMMDEETWLNAKKAESLGFVDGILFSKEPEQIAEEPETENISIKKIQQSFLQKVSASAKSSKTIPIQQLEQRLELLKY